MEIFYWVTCMNFRSPRRQTTTKTFELWYAASHKEFDWNLRALSGKFWRKSGFDWLGLEQFSQWVIARGLCIAFNIKNAFVKQKTLRKPTKTENWLRVITKKFKVLKAPQLAVHEWRIPNWYRKSLEFWFTELRNQNVKNDYVDRTK